MRIWVANSNGKDTSFHLFKFMARRAERKVWAEHGAGDIYYWQRQRFPSRFVTVAKVGHRSSEIELATYVACERLGL